MLDSDYDALYDALLPWYPDLESKVGAAVPRNASQRMTRLPNMMASLKKFKPDEFVDPKLGKNITADWENRLGTDQKLVMAKIDGGSAQIINKNGKRSLFSRGDGTTGQDVSHLLPHLKVGECPPGYAIRFEVVITLKAFARVQALFPAKKYTAPRNVASTAILNAARADPRLVEHATCIAFTIYKPRMTPTAALRKLKDLGWTIPRCIRVKDANPAALTVLLKAWKPAAPYEMDGLVVAKDVYESPGQPKPTHMVAFKIDDPPQRATVSKVVWEASEYGLLKPVAHFVTPVHIGGVSVTKATAHDARMIKTKGIGPGAVIGIIRSGDVIPKIVDVYKKTKPSMPDPANYRWANNGKGANIEAVGTFYRNDILIARRAAFFSAIGVLGFGESLASKLTALSIPEIARQTTEQLRARGVGQADAQKLPTAIKTALTGTTVPRLMAASSIFGSGFGMTKANAAWGVLNGNPPKNPAELTARIAAIHGFSFKSAQHFAHRWPKWRAFWAALPHKPSVTGGNSLAGKVYAFSEFRDKELEKYITSNGGTVTNSVSAKVSAVFAHPQATTVKVQKAQSLNVPVIAPSAAREHVGFKAS